MSIVIGIKTRSDVYLGSDSCIVNRDGNATVAYRVFPMEKCRSCVMGCVGSVEIINALKTDTLRLVPSYWDVVDYKYISATMCPSIRKLMDSIGMLKKRDDGVSDMGSSLLVGNDDGIFIIDRYFNVLKVDDFCAVGDGAQYALESLYETVGMNPEIRIKKAIAAAAKAVRIEYPISVIHSKGRGKIALIPEREFK